MSLGLGQLLPQATGNTQQRLLQGHHDWLQGTVVPKGTG